MMPALFNTCVRNVPAGGEDSLFGAETAPELLCAACIAELPALPRSCPRCALPSPAGAVCGVAHTRLAHRYFRASWKVRSGGDCHARQPRGHRSAVPRDLERPVEPRSRASRWVKRAIGISAPGHDPGAGGCCAQDAAGNRRIS